MWLNQKSKLKTSYFRSFFGLIVVPILLIFIVSIGIIKLMMKDAAIQNISHAQDNIVSMLSSEIDDVSLRLSHFVYVNNNEIVELAAKTDSDDMAKKYNYTQELTESFNFVMAPMQDIIAAAFFMKDGTYTYLKDNFTLPLSMIKQSDWYEAALKHKNVVKVGSYNTNVTYTKRASYPFTIAVGLAPGIDVDKAEKLEMVTLFQASNIGSLVRKFNKDKLLGSTMVLDQNNNILFDMNGSAALLPDDIGSHGTGSFEERMDKTRYTYVVSEPLSTGWKVVNVVNTSVLTYQFNRIAAFIVAVIMVVFGMFYLFSAYFLKSIIKPVNDMVVGLEQVERGSLDVHIEPSGQSEIRTMTHTFNHMTDRLKILIQENEEEQQKKHEAEMRALQSQINPHFLVNSLSSIRFMAQVSKFDGIRKMAEALIKILSCSFRSNVGFYTVAEELEVLDSYVYLMKIRYSDGFEVHYQVEESCREIKIPRLILQPIVENSIVHGFSELVDDIGRVDLTVCMRKGFLCFEVKDNGKGMTEEEIQRILARKDDEEADNISIGIINVYTRLMLNYGKECKLLMKSEPGSYTVTTIMIPIRNEEAGKA